MASFALVYPALKSVLVDPGWMRTRMGGDEATDDPAENAHKIFELIQKHTSLQTGKLYSMDGEVLEW